MTATLTPQRHIILKTEKGEASSLPQEQEYHVMISTGGVILLRPQKMHQRTLLEHLEAMRELGGIEVLSRRDPVPDRVGL
jgi:hypothetical protein